MAAPGCRPAWPGAASTQLALRFECLAVLALTAGVTDVPWNGDAAALVAGAYVIAMQVAILQLLQSPLTQHVCAPGALRRQPPPGAPGWAMIAWKSAVFNPFWVALQLAALTALLKR